MKTLNIKLKYVFILATCLSASCLLCAAGFTDRLNFRPLTVNENLSQNTVWGFMQDNNRKIWIGTTDGLNRYDGYTFTTYYHDSDDSLSIADNQVFSLCSDAEGTSWFGTLLGLSRYNPDSDTFTNYYLPECPFQVLAIEDVPERRELYLATNIGLVAFHKASGTLKAVPSLKHLVVNNLARKGNRLLLGTSGGLFVYSIEEKKVERIMEQQISEAVASVTYNPQSDNYWLATQKNEIYHIDGNYRMVKKYKLDDGNVFSRSNMIRVLRFYANGDLWIGTTRGLYSFNLERETFTALQTRSSIRAIFLDDQGGVWVGTFYDGVNYYHSFAPTFRIMGKGSSPNFLNDRIVSCIVEDPHTQNLWIGTNDGGVNYYDRRKETFSYYKATGSGNGLRSNNIKAIVPHPSGDVYVGTHTGGLSCIHTRTGQVENFDIPHEKTENNSCYSLLDDGDQLYVGSMVGLFTFDKRSKKFKKPLIANRYPDLSGALIRSLYRDSFGRMWIGSEKGLHVYDGKKEAKLLKGERDSRIIAYAVYEDAHHCVWVASANGLYCYDANLRLQRHYTMKDGLENSCIYGLLEDSSRRLWLSTNRGISCFNIDSEQFYNYHLKDGLSHTEFNAYGYCKGKDGTLYFGSLNGITYFSPFYFMENPFSPRPDVVGISLMNEPVTYCRDGVSEVEWDKDGRLRGIVFPSDQRQFDIHFTVSNYLDNQRNSFSYMLKGYDKTWVATQERSVRYSNLQPGYYTFLVKSCNNNGKWCETPTEFYVHITPMWYQTWFAKSLFILLCVGLAVWIMYFFIIRAKMRMQMQMEMKEHARKQELDAEKIRFYVNISHELRTPLSLILAPLEELMDTDAILDKKARQSLQYVYRNSRRLLHIVNQLLHFRKAEKGALPVHVEVCDVEDWIKQIYMLFSNQARTKEINYLFHSELQTRMLPIDKKYVETILVNLLSNAFKFTPDNGQIEVELWENEDSFGFVVKDNGRGISPEKLERIFERFYQVNDNEKGTGIGLSLVKCLVVKHRGDIKVESRLGEYTVFTVSLPKSIEVYSKEERAEQIMEEQPASGIEELVSLQTEDNVSDNESVEQKESRLYKILLVDDNKEMLDYLKNALQLKYEVLIASNGKAALDVMKENKVDLVLSDVMMPEMDGIQFCKVVKRNIQTAHIPVILLSAKS